jgi:hypothetical protein
MGHSAEIELFSALYITDFPNFFTVYLLLYKILCNGKKIKQYLKRHMKTRLYLVTSGDLKEQRIALNISGQML